MTIFNNLKMLYGRVLGILRPPDIKKFKKRNDVKGLVKALSFEAFPGRTVYSEFKLRRLAAKYLGEIGDNTAVIPLLELLQNSSNESMKVTIVGALGNIGDPLICERLIDIYSSESNRVKSQILLALGNTGDRQSLSTLLSGLEDSSFEVKESAITSLGILKDPTAVGHLVRLYKTETNQFRESIVKTLTKLGWQPDKNKLDNWEFKEKEISSLRIPKNLENKIASKGDLPPLPEILLRFNKKIRENESSFSQIADLIRTDAAISAKIIKVANSSYFAAGRVTLTNLASSLTRLGINEVKNIVNSLALLRQFDNQIVIDKRKFWWHSLFVAFCSQSLCEIMGTSRAIQEKVYMSGLMHDIGLLVFGYIAPESYSNFLQSLIGDHSNDPGFNFPGEEADAFGADHSVVGAAYIDHWWPLDKAIVQAVNDHHKRPNSRDLSTISRIVILVNDYCNCAGIRNGLNMELAPREFDLDKLQTLGMNDQQIDRFEEIAQENIDRAKLLY